jgi:hypothetical protein
MLHALAARVIVKFEDEMSKCRSQPMDSCHLVNHCA